MTSTRAPVSKLVFVNAMIPEPGETPGAWWDDTGHEAERIFAAKQGGYPSKFDVETYFLHDVPPDVVAAAATHQRDEADVVFTSPCRFEQWPDVDIHVIAGDDDRFFPVDFQRRVVRERLQRDVDLVPGGHLAALSHPRELAEQLLSYLRAPRARNSTRSAELR